MWHLCLQLQWLRLVLSLPPSPLQLAEQGLSVTYPLMGGFRCRIGSAAIITLKAGFSVLLTLFCLDRRMAVDFL